MKASEAIMRASGHRPDVIIPDQMKREWLHSLEAEFAEMMNIDIPDPLVDPDTLDDPSQEPELMIPAPYDEVYVLWLLARIDYYQEEMALYADDMVFATQAKNEVKAWWRRHNIPEGRKYYRGVWR